MNQAQTDEWLMAQVAQGRRELLEPLVRRHANALLTFLRRLVGDPHLAEDLFQDVFLAVWVKRKQYQPYRPFRPWLYAIAVNKCRADYRARQVPVYPLETDVAGAVDGSSPTESAIATETARVVTAAVTRLPVQQRLVVALRIWEGRSYAEIAQLTGRTEGTVRSHMHHGLSALREYLEPRLREQ